MNKQQIKDLALSNGFKLKQQPSGEMDLNPYVYEFASALIAKSNERVAELESYNVKLANESHEYQKRVKELEKERETGYEVWQAKYHALKDSMSLTTCYECGTRVYELSPRSRCCMCEYGRAQFNERENEQLRKEQE